MKEPLPYNNLTKTIYMNVKKINSILVNNFKFGNFPKHPLPSTGIVTILYFILMKKFKKIYIYGFDNLIPNQRMHYFENKIYDEGIVHSSILEKNFIDYFINKGILINLENSDRINLIN